MGDSMFTTLVRASKYSSVREFNDYAEQKKIYNKLFYEEVRNCFCFIVGLINCFFTPQVWDKMQFDGIIAPVQALPTLPHG